LPGVYLWKNAAGRVLYVGKAKNLRNRVRNYLTDEKRAEAKTGTLVSEASTVEYILVDNEKEALALENNLIKQFKPRFNVLLKDDKTYPYIKLTREPYPRVYVTRRLRKDGAHYYGPYIPASLAHRLVHFIHRHFKVPSCTVDLSRKHTHPCLQYHIGRCHGPCVEGLTTKEDYGKAVKDVRNFLDGKTRELVRELRGRMEAASEDLRFEEAANLRDLIGTIEEAEQKQKMAAAEGENIDIFASYAEPPLVALNLFHLRNGRIVDRHEYFWEDQAEFDLQEFYSALLKQFYLDQKFIPNTIHVPTDFEDREALEDLLSERRGGKVEIHTPQRGQKKAMVALAATNAKHSFDARFRVMKPSTAAIKDSLRDTLNLEDAPTRIECFDISHIQGTDKVASMVVWEEGRMKKADYRKFIIQTVIGNDDFASMFEVVTRRYRRLLEEEKPFPGLVLIDGGLGQLHAAARALEELGIINQPLASVAKREEIIYVYGQENEPVKLDRFHPVLHLIQVIRDEAHRFAVTFHRARRQKSRMVTELTELPGIGAKTAQKLLKHFGSVERVREATPEQRRAIAGAVAAKRLQDYFGEDAVGMDDAGEAADALIVLQGDSDLPEIVESPGSAVVTDPAVTSDQDSKDQT